MAIQFTCPHCGGAQTADERYAGATGPCTACGKSVVVPGGPAQFAPTKSAGSNAGIGGILLIIGVIGLVALLGCGGVLIALLLPAVQSAREAARRMQSSNNEKQILLALHNYHDTYKQLPPAYIPDANGKPMHSWRVLILPYIEQGPLYAQYNFSKPWDSPENLAVAESMPQVFRSPFEDPTPQNRNHTSYMLFAGKGTIFEDPQAKITFDKIPDGLANTIALTEVNGSGVIWTQPTDLDAAQLDFAIHSLRDAQPGQINSANSRGVTMSTFDGAVRFVPTEVSPATLRSAVDPDDGQAVNLP